MSNSQTSLIADAENALEESVEAPQTPAEPQFDDPVETPATDDPTESEFDPTCIAENIEVDSSPSLKDLAESLVEEPSTEAVAEEGDEFELPNFDDVLNPAPSELIVKTKKPDDPADSSVTADSMTIDSTESANETDLAGRVPSRYRQYLEIARLVGYAIAVVSVPVLVLLDKPMGFVGPKVRMILGPIAIGTAIMAVLTWLLTCFV